MRRHARFPLENVVERSSGVDTNYKRSMRNQPSMYQSRGKQSRHGGNCANRIINTFRPLHYGCNERFLCTFPCADFAPLFAQTCDRSMHSRAKIRIQGNDQRSSWFFITIRTIKPRLSTIVARVSYLWLLKTIFIIFFYSILFLTHCLKVLF